MIHFVCQLVGLPRQWCRTPEPEPLRTRVWAEVTCPDCRRNARATVEKHAPRFMDLFPLPAERGAA